MHRPSTVVNSIFLISWFVPLSAFAWAQGSMPMGSEFQVNTYTTNFQYASSVAMDSDGDFVVVWQSYGQDGSASGIFGQRINKGGSSLGSEFQVNTYTMSYQSWESVAMDSGGDFVVVWQSNDRVFGQRIDSAGSLLGGEFQVNTYTSGFQRLPSVAMDSDGDFVVVWASDGRDGSSWGVFGQRFDSAGSFLGSDFKVNTYTTGTQFVPSVAMGFDEDFVVVWQSYGQDGSSYGVFGQRFDSAGSLLGSEFQVNTYTIETQYVPSVAMDSDGDFVVVWNSWRQDGSAGGVFGQRFDSAGSFLGSEFQVNTYTWSIQARASVALDSDGDFVVVWDSFGQDGTPLSHGVFGQRFDNTGSLLGAEFQINTYTTSSQLRAAVGMDSDGDFVVAWASYYGQDGSNSGVFGQRFHGGASVLLGLGSGGSSGWSEELDTDAPHTHLRWPRVAWSLYNASNGESRPAACDVDGDGRDEVVLGLGAGGAGWLEVKDDVESGFAHLAWIQVDWPAYNTANGESFPACGDLDGDGRAEIVAGLGNGGGGWLKGFDDATAGYAALPGTPTAGGWLRVTGFGSYNSGRGEVHPAIGNLDGDMAMELVLGLGATGGGWVQVLDDQGAGFAPLGGTPFAQGWLQLGWGSYNTARGETWPAVGDLDGDGRGELVLGLGNGGDGWLQVLGDQAAGFAPVAGTPTAGGWLQVPFAPYNAAVGVTFPALADLDGDRRDEMVIGLGPYPTSGGWWEVREDLVNGLVHDSWGRVQWSSYNAADGSARPAVRR